MATSKVAANLRAKMRDVNRRSESPVAIPRAPPPGLAKAVRRDWEIAVRTSGGTWALANCVSAPVKSVRASPSSRSSLKCSAVAPLRPGAALHFAVRNASTTSCSERCSAASGQ